MTMRAEFGAIFFVCFIANASPLVPLDGSLLINTCRTEGNAFICSPAMLSPQENGSIFNLTKFQEVTLDIDVAGVPRDQLELKGSTVDPKNQEVFWHAGCNSQFFITNGLTGETRKFTIDPKRLGIPNLDGGICLGEFVFDGNLESVIALGGRFAGGRSMVEFAVLLRGDGNYLPLFVDLATKVPPRFGFLHPNQTIASFDPVNNEIVVPLTSGAERMRLVLNVEAGSVRFIPGGAGVQHQFYDAVLEDHVYFQCHTPGFETLSTTLFSLDTTILSSVGIDDTCFLGFVGASYDSMNRLHYMLLRKGRFVDPLDTFVIGISDLASGRFEGIVETNATYEDFHVGSRGAETFFFNVDFLRL